MAAARMVTAGLAVLLAFATGTSTALAGNARETRGQAESSLQVSGSLVIGGDGKVLSHALNPAEGLTPELIQFLGTAVSAWRFAPILVDGRPVQAKVPMWLRLMAKRTDDGRVNVRIAGSYFGSQRELPATALVRAGTLTPPVFPREAMQMGGRGIVYLIVRVGRDGKVIDAAPEQVNLRVVGTDKQMTMLRKTFADAARRVALSWIFQPPTTGEEVGKPYWVVRVPVDFTTSDERRPGPGQWQTVIPGPRLPMPWASKTLQTAGSPDALPDNGIFPLEQGARLLDSPAS